MTWVELWRRSICSIFLDESFMKKCQKKLTISLIWRTKFNLTKKIQFCQLNFEVICLKKLWGAAKWFYGLLCFVFCFFFVKFARVFRVSVQIHLCSQTFVLAWRSAFYRPAASLSCCCYFVAVHLCKILFATKSTACTAKHTSRTFDNLTVYTVNWKCLQKKDPLCATSCCWDIVGKNWPNWLMI